jgi:16S rRNA (cytidine1402-2'-O)-methyltransferase
VVATPIGNLRDITLRALDLLKNVDVIAAEDTRHTHKLLAAHGITARTIAAHEHNEQAAGEQICKLLSDGASVALVTDAGTPAVSDPGARIVRLVRERGFRIVPLPGPSALSAALSIAGFAGRRVLFEGFLPSKAGERAAALSALAGIDAALVFFEAPHRVGRSLREMARIFGAQRRVVIARELTKTFEEIHACALGEAASWLDSRDARTRGEFVLLVEPDSRPAKQVPASDKTLRALIAEMPLKQAVKLAAEITGEKRNDLYRRALSLKKDTVTRKASHSPGKG